MTELIPELPEMVDEKKGDLDKVVLNSDVLKKYFPKSYTPLRMQETIIWICSALLYCSAFVFGLISTIIGLLGLAVLITYSVQNGIVLLVIAFLDSKTRDVYTAYRKAGYSKKFLAEHEADILLYKAAKKSL